MHLLHKLDSSWRKFKLSLAFHKVMWNSFLMLILEILIYALGVRKICLFI